MQKWDEKDVDGKVTYGRRTAKAQVSFEGGYLERRYDDNIDGPTLAERATCNGSPHPRASHAVVRGGLARRRADQLGIPAARRFDPGLADRAGP